MVKPLRFQMGHSRHPRKVKTGYGICVIRAEFAYHIQHRMFTFSTYNVIQKYVSLLFKKK
jgi:hypothetical protein